MSSIGSRVSPKPSTRRAATRRPVSPGKRGERSAGRSPRARQLEQHLLDAEAVAHLGSWQIDLATGALTISPQLRRILGWAWPGEPNLAQICELAHPDDRARVEDWIGRNPAQHKSTAGCFFRLVRADGTVGTFYGRRAYRLGASGMPARICGTIEDVTEQVASEQAINEAAHLYRDIFENCAWGVFQTTADGRYRTANPALARIYGYDSPSELLSRLTDIGGQLYVDPQRRAEFVAIMKQDGVVNSFESQVYRRDGAVIWISETCREVRTSTGRLLYYEGTVRDVSKRRHDEAALRQANEAAEAAKLAVMAVNQELERRVAERTAELHATQDELLRQERLSTVGKFTATVAHELRNPLSAIRNTLHFIRGMPGAEALPLDRPVARIERSVARCDHIISDLIDFAHTRSLQRRAVKLDSWLDEVLDNCVVPDGIAIERHFAATGAVVRIDADRFKRAMINLVDNAVQALVEHAAPEARITVATAAGKTMRIVVTDNGPGIAPDILPKVFDALFSTKSFGTGLGLPTVRQIVEQHDGTVAITSTPGRGTAVEINLAAA